MKTSNQTTKQADVSTDPIHKRFNLYELVFMWERIASSNNWKKIKVNLINEQASINKLTIKQTSKQTVIY